MLHIIFSKYDCIIVHKAYYLFTCTCVSINSFYSHSHSLFTTGASKFQSSAIHRRNHLSYK